MKTHALLTLALSLSLHTAQADLAAWWPFDGNFSDPLNAANDGTRSATLTFDTDVRDGLIGESLRFGADDAENVSIAANPSLDSTLFTLGYFINQDGAIQGNAGLERLTSRGGDSFETAIGDASIFAEHPDDGVSQLSYHVGGVGWTVTEVVVPATGWVHVAWRNTAANMEIYLDGVLAFTGPRVEAPTGAMLIGARLNQGPIESYEGLIDDVFIWDDNTNPLTPETLAMIAQSGISGILEDTDGDGLLNVWEIQHNLDPNDNGENPNNNGVPGDPDNGASGDPDMDMVPNIEEFENFGDPRDPDTDDDNLTDAQEIALHTEEVKCPFLNDTDSDNDGLDDKTEFDGPTDICDPDSDDDGFLDGFEIDNNTDPLDPDSTPDPSSSLVLHLDFEENVMDQSGTGNDGTLIGGAAFSTDIPPVLGGGYSLMAANSGGVENQGVDIPASATLAPNAFTLAYWIKANAQGSAAGLERLTSRSGDKFETAIGSGSALGGATPVPSGITLSYYNGGWSRTDVEIIADQWIHVAWVNAGGQMELYLDGVLSFTGAGVANGRVTDQDFMRVATRHNDLEGYDGLIDDVRLYAIPLNAEQVMDLASGAGSSFVLRITGITRGPDGSVTLEWNGQPGRGYFIYVSPTLSNWPNGELSDSETSPYTLPAGDLQFDPAAEPELYFRVSQEPLE